MPPRRFLLVPLAALLVAPSAVSPAAEAKAAARPGFARRLVPPGGGEWHRSPITIGRKRTSVWNADAGEGRYYVVFGPALDPCWGEGARYEPPVAPATAAVDLKRLRRFERHAVAAPPARLHLSFGVEGGEARAWVWTTERTGVRVRFFGRAPTSNLVDLVEYAYGHELRPAGPSPMPDLYFK